MRKSFRVLSLILLLNIANQSLIANAESDKELLIEELNRTETQTSLLLKTNEEGKIKLPDGNWISGKEAIYTVSTNGNHDFKVANHKGEVETKTYNVSGLRKKLLVTNKREVNLKLQSSDSLSGVGYFKLKNDTNGTWSAYENYTGTSNSPMSKAWTLSAGEGLKSVYVMFKDIAGNETVEVYDQIYLDLTGPKISNFTINNGATHTNKRTVTLNVSSTDNYSEVSHYLISNDNSNWTRVEYKSPISWELSPNSGSKTVYLKAVDTLGNVGDVVSRSIYFDEVLPTGSITINNGATLTNSRNVKLQLSFADNHSGIKRVTIHEKDKSYTFPTIPTSPTEIDWTLSLGVTGMVTLEVEDMAGNIYRTNSQTISIATLEVSQFRLINVVNPLSQTSSFNPIKWDFPPQEMLSGANIEFDINYKLDLDNTTTAKVGAVYKVEIIGDNYNKVIELPYDEEIFKGFKAKVTIPLDAPKEAKIYVSSKLTATLTSGADTFTNEAYFPNKNEKALIGVIKGNIKESIKFNELN